MRLGDFLPNERKKSLKLPKGIAVGTVLRAFVNFTTPPKEKRFIVVGFHEDEIHLASVLINSDINFNINFGTEMIACQYEIKKGDREYLEHDSFVDCSELHNIDLSEINSKIDKDPDMVIGHVEKEDLDGIMKTIQSSKTIKGKIKKKCGVYDYKF